MRYRELALIDVTSIETMLHNRSFPGTTSRLGIRPLATHASKAAAHSMAEPRALSK
jgi:hypothetical protein